MGTIGQDACCVAVRRYLSRRIGKNLVVTERPDLQIRNEAAVEEVWRSESHGYVVEHTRVEAFEGQIQDDIAFTRLVEPLQRELAGLVPGRFSVSLHWGVASTSGVKFSEARAVMASLIKEHAPRLATGEAVLLRSDDLPFELRLLKRRTQESRVFFSRWIEDAKTSLLSSHDGSVEGERVHRIGKALDRKTPKLLVPAENYKLPSVLILESNDFVLSNVFEVAQAFKGAIAGRSHLPDLVFLVETDGPLYGWLLKDRDTILPRENYFEDDGAISEQ